MLSAIVAFITTFVLAYRAEAAILKGPIYLPHCTLCAVKHHPVKASMQEKTEKGTLVPVTLTKKR